MSQKYKVSLLPVYFVLFIDNFAFAVIFAMFGSLFMDPSYGMVTQTTSALSKNMMLGVALALFPVGQFFGAPLLGNIADRFGRKKAFYITIIGGLAWYILSGFSILIHSYTLLILSRLATGFFSGNMSICLASIADLSPDEKTRAKNFSIIVILTGISWMFAILTGSYLSDSAVSSHFNPALPFFVTAVLAFLSFLGIMKFFKETHPMQEKFHIDLLKGFRDIKSSFALKELCILYMIYMLWIIGWGIAIQWYNPVALQTFKVSSLEVNWGQFIVGITWIFGGYYVNNFIIKRWNPRPWIVVANALLALSLFGVTLSNSFFLFALFFMVGCIPSAFAWPNMLSLISINAPKGIQGKVMGISQSARSFGLIIATILGGIVAGTSLKIMFLFATIFVFFSFLLIFYFHIKKAASSKG